MKVIFFDKKRETYARVEDVKQLRVDWLMKRGKPCKSFICIRDDGWKTLTCAQYELDRVEE